MPQRHCCVPNCSSSLIEGAILHAFPNPSTDLEKFQAWVINAGLLGEDDSYVFKNRRICHIHFEEIYHYPKNRLSKLAIPTLYLPVLPPTTLTTTDTNIFESNIFERTTLTTTDTNIFEPSSSVMGTTATCSYIPASTSTENLQTFTVANIGEPSSSKGNTSYTRTRRYILPKYESEMELYKAVAKTKNELNRCKQAKQDLRAKLKIARQFTHSKAFNLVAKNLSPAAKIFFEMQIRQSAKHPKGHRFTLDEKVLALSLYKPSPKAYHLLSQICVLPKKNTLNKLMNKIYLTPGSNDLIFEHLKKRVDKMPNSHKYCTIIFDEMAIAPHLAYDQQTDQIKGFCDDGWTRSKRFADLALVFMVRGIFKKYKQPIAYSFCTGTTSKYSLKNQIQCILEKVLQTGLKVVATICDQGSTNIAAINLLIDNTKRAYLQKGHEYKGGFFEIDGEIIYPIYDPPHLLKGIRNNLLTKNLEFEIDKKKYVAKWDHIVALYKRGPGYRGMRLVPKLTARHVIPNLIPKMKVKFSTQVFSRTVSIAMGFTAGTGRIPKESTDTAELLLFFDKLFDSVNGNHSIVNKGKVYRSAVSPKSPHHKLWHKSLPVLKSMRFVGGRVGMVPSISSWIKTIQAFQEITKKLHSLGLRSLLLRNFNQDPLENFFGSIRAHGQRNVMPNSCSFEASYKALLINNMTSHKSVGANCEADDGYCLQSLKFLLNADVIRPLPKDIEININHLNIELINVDDLINSQAPGDLEKCAAAAYCSGWLLNSVNRNITKSCSICTNDLEGDSEEVFSKFITLKKNTSKSLLHYPSKELFEYLIQIENIVIEILKSECEIRDITQYIELVANYLLSLNFITCTNHGQLLKKYIVKKSILLILHDWCKEVNNLLSGKNIVYDQNDCIKEMAHEYFKKHKMKRN